MKIKEGKEKQWSDLVLVSDDYIARGVMRFVAGFIAIVEPRLDAGEPINGELVHEGMRDGNTEKYTNEMIGAGMRIIVEHWHYGDVLEAWRMETEKRMQEEVIRKLQEENPHIKFVSVDNIQEAMAVVQSLTTPQEQKN